MPPKRIHSLLAANYNTFFSPLHIWTGTGASGDEGNERFSPYNYLPTWQSRLACLACHNPAKPMEIASDCNPSFSPRRRGFVSHPGSLGHWGRGGGFACRPPPLINGPDDSGSASSGKNSRAAFWGGVPVSGVRGCSGCCPLRVPPCPILRWSSVGSVFSCSGETCYA
jgi:hypothetical protein